MIKKSITVTDKQDNWIKAQIAKGDFGNESELIRELIRERKRKEEENVSHIEAIRAKLVKAEKSGFINEKADEILNDIKKELFDDD